MQVTPLKEHYTVKTLLLSWIEWSTHNDHLFLNRPSTF